MMAQELPHTRVQDGTEAAIYGGLRQRSGEGGRCRNWQPVRSGVEQDVQHAPFSIVRGQALGWAVRTSGRNSAIGRLLTPGQLHKLQPTYNPFAYTRHASQQENHLERSNNRSDHTVRPGLRPFQNGVKLARMQHHRISNSTIQE